MHPIPPRLMRALCCAALCLTILCPPAAGAPVKSTPAEPPEASAAVIARLGPKGIAKALERQANRPLPDRLEYWSGLFLNTPYWVTPEGGEHIAGAVTETRSQLELRWVDCESFVEQVIALAVSRRAEDIEGHIRRIRYRGGMPDPARRHFTVVKGWLAENLAAGYLKSITRRVGGPLTRLAERDLTPQPSWRPYYLQRFFSLGVHAPRGTARIDHIPISVAVSSQRGRLFHQIPSGTLVHLVSAPHERSPYLVTHVGFVLKTSRGPVFRHASQSPHRRRVEDRPLGPYLTYVSRTPAGPEMRTATGVHLSEVMIPNTR